MRRPDQAWNRHTLRDHDRRWWPTRSHRGRREHDPEPRADASPPLSRRLLNPWETSACQREPIRPAFATQISLVVADDDSSVRASTADALGSIGLSVHTARTGDEMIALTFLHAPPVVVAVLRSTTSAASEVRKLVSMPNRPAVVAISPQATPRHRQDLVNAGASAVLYRATDDPVPIVVGLLRILGFPDATWE